MLMLFFYLHYLKKKKNFLGLKRFKILKSKTLLKVIALGGINENNLKRLGLLDVYGFASISFFGNKKKGP